MIANHIRATEEWRLESSAWKEEHQKEIKLKNKGMEQVKSNKLVATRRKQSGAKDAMQEIHLQLFEGLEFSLSQLAFLEPQL